MARYTDRDIDEYGIDLNHKKELGHALLALLGTDRVPSLDRPCERTDLTRLIQIHCPEHDPTEMTTNEMRHALCDELVDDYDGYFASVGPQDSPSLRKPEVREIYLATREAVDGGEGE